MESFDGEHIHLKNYELVFNDKYISFLRGNFDIVKICKEIETLTMSELCVVSILKDTINTYYINNPKIILCEDNPLYYRSIDIKKVVVSNDLKKDPRGKQCDECILKTMCSIPIIYKDICYGQLLLGNKPKYTRRTLTKISDHLDILFTMIISMEEQNMFKRTSSHNDKFFSTLSHELRTPIHSMVSIISLLNSGNNLTSAQREYINRINESCESLVSTISDSVDFEKIKAGNIGIINESFNLEELIGKIADLVQYKIQKKKLSFNVHIQSDIVKNVYGDHKRIKQVLINLIVNAIKYTDNGGITLKVNSNSDHIQFAVIDTGIGIPKEHIAKIFDDYYQVNNNSAGMGLGLSLCKRLIHLMGGDITVVSTVNKGSKFTFSIPLPQEIFPEINSDDPYKVLVITPEESQRIQLRDYFSQWNVDCEILSSYNEGRKLLHKNFNVFILDVKKSFGEAIAFLRHIQINFESCKLIALNQEQDLQGFDEFLPDSNNKISVYNSLISPRRKERRVSTSLDNIKICIVEDDPNSSYALQQILISLGIQEANITCVDDADHAVRIITHSQFNVVFMDCKLKGSMSGITVTKLVKQQLSYVRIYGVTAEISSMEKSEWISSGIESLLIKPFNIDSIRPIISSL